MRLEDLLTGQKVQPSKIEPAVVEIPDYILNDPPLVGYPDLEMQNEIYGWVTGTLFQFTNPDEPCNFIVKDFGAGRGDISTWLVGNNIQYLGIETNPILIEAGIKKYGDNPNSFQLVQNDFFNTEIKSDFTICVGTLNSIPTENKWGLFRRTMQKALETTKQSIIFVLSSRFDVEGFNDFPLKELHDHLPNNPFTLDCSKFEDIYMLVVHVDEFKQ